VSRETVGAPPASDPLPRGGVGRNTFYAEAKDEEGSNGPLSMTCMLPSQVARYVAGLGLMSGQGRGSGSGSGTLVASSYSDEREHREREEYEHREGYGYGYE
jgi:hypothetical protein